MKNLEKCLMLSNNKKQQKAFDIMISRSESVRQYLKNYSSNLYVLICGIILENNGYTREERGERVWD